MAVSKLLGHAQITTTQVYLDHLAMEDLRGALPDLPMG
jgi:site-specific recombinase XerD